jgi:hypothetical protein
LGAGRRVSSKRVAFAFASGISRHVVLRSHGSCFPPLWQPACCGRKVRQVDEEWQGGSVPGKRAAIAAQTATTSKCRSASLSPGIGRSGGVVVSECCQSEIGGRLTTRSSGRLLHLAWSSRLQSVHIHSWPGKLISVIMVCSRGGASKRAALARRSSAPLNSGVRPRRRCETEFLAQSWLVTAPLQDEANIVGAAGSESGLNRAKP